MKKQLPLAFFSLFAIILIVPSAVSGAGLVPCNGPDCTIGSFFVMLVNIYTFLVFWIATPLAVLALTIGGVFMMFGGANPNMFSRGKQIIYLAIAGLVLVFGSYLIIDFVLRAIGFTGNWSSI
jgi:hypothetical protein